MNGIRSYIIWICLLLLLGNMALADGRSWLQLPVPLPIPHKTKIPPKKLTLRDAILLALRMNPNVRSAEIQRVADKFALEVAHNQFQPQGSLVADGTFQEGNKPQYNLAPTGTLVSPLGGQFELNYNNSFNGPGSSSETFAYTQHLLRGFGPKVTYAPLVQANYTEQVARLNLKNTVMSTITAVIQAYYQLVSDYNALKVNQLALQNSLATMKQESLFVKAGRTAPTELLQQQSQVASQRLQVTQAKNAIQQDYQALLTVLGLDPNSHIVIDTTMPLEELHLPSIDNSYQLALENNVAYQQAIYSLKQQEVQVLLAKDQQKWQLDLVATKTIVNDSQSDGLVSTINGSNTSISNVSDTNDSIQLNLNIPLNQKQIKQQLVDAKVALEQQTIQLDENKRALRAQVMNNIQALIYQRQQILQAQAAVNYAQRVLDVELEKLSYGRSTLFEVTQLRGDLTNAKLSLIGQQIAYINTLAQFEETVGMSLDKWGIEICY